MQDDDDDEDNDDDDDDDDDERILTAGAVYPTRSQFLKKLETTKISGDWKDLGNLKLCRTFAADYATTASEGRSLQTMENNKTTSKTLLHLFLTAKPKVMLLKSAEQEGVCPFNMTWEERKAAELLNLDAVDFRICHN